MYLVTSQQMRLADQKAIQDHQIPSLQLMENAGAGTFQILQRRFPDLNQKNIIVVVGKGNNGGDGLVVARLLREAGCEVVVLLVPLETELKGDCRLEWQRYREVGGQTLPFREDLLKEAKGAEILIDALFGTGLSKGVQGNEKRIIETVNEIARTSKKWVVSLDIPSGLSADTGRAMGVAVKARLTVTFGLPKLGLVLPGAAPYAGEIEVIDIGVPPSIFKNMNLKTHWVTANDVAPWFAPRERETHKGTYGHVLLVGGSENKAGAILLSGRAALRTGSGLVTVALPDKAFKRIPSGPPFAKGGMGGFLELMYEPLPSTKRGTIARRSLAGLLKWAAGKEALGVGPGLGLDTDTKAVVRGLLEKSKISLVLDADAINGIASFPKVLKKLKAPAVLTPHPGEMARLCKTSTASVQKKRLEIAKSFAEKYGVFLVLKGFRTVTATPQGEVFINSSGNPGMATAGMGDVLTGIITSLLGQGLDPRSAAVAGVFLHGRAGDRVAERLGDRGLLATDVIDEIPLALRETTGV